MEEGVCAKTELRPSGGGKREDAGLKHALITVKPAKTGRKVEMRILPMLHEELEQTPRGDAEDVGRGAEEACDRGGCGRSSKG